MNAIPDLRSIAAALYGEISDGQVLAPGPNHGRTDRSLAVKPVPTHPDGFVVFSHAGDDPIQCKDYVRSRLGLPQWEPKARNPGDVRYTASYVYRQADGTPYLRVSRTEPKGPFPQSHWTGSTWQSGKPKGPKIPYRLPELLANLNAPVFVCEGEKDSDRLAALGFVATTNSEGAGSWTVDLDPYLAGRRCFILEDNDSKGADHVAKVARHLAPTASEVRIVKLPDLPPKGDVSDWLNAGGDAAGLVELCRSYPLFNATTQSDTPARKARRRDENDTRPVIKIMAGQIKDAVDAAESALISKGGRVRYVVAALTIVLAFKASGAPRQSSPLGSFEDWSALVRDALLWLGCADAVDTMERARVSDPKLDELMAVLTQWRSVIGNDKITVRRVIEKATRQTAGTGFDYSKSEFSHPDFREALLAIAGQGGAINGKRLGKWLASHAKRIADGCWIEQGGVLEGTATWRLVTRKQEEGLSMCCN